MRARDHVEGAKCVVWDLLGLEGEENRVCSETKDNETRIVRGSEETGKVTEGKNSSGKPAKNWAELVVRDEFGKAEVSRGETQDFHHKKKQQRYRSKEIKLCTEKGVGREKTHKKKEKILQKKKNWYRKPARGTGDGQKKGLQEGGCGGGVRQRQPNKKKKKKKNSGRYEA